MLKESVIPNSNTLKYVLEGSQIGRPGVFSQKGQYCLLKRSKRVEEHYYKLGARREVVFNRQVSEVLEDIAIGAGGPEFDSRAGQCRQCRQRFVTVVIFFRSCTRRGGGPRHSLHALA